MNKGIKQILNDSGLDIKHGGIVLTKNITGSEALEKFAELIVRECAEICLEDNDHRNILRHFGLEQ